MKKVLLASCIILAGYTAQAQIANGILSEDSLVRRTFMQKASDIDWPLVQQQMLQRFEKRIANEQFYWVRAFKAEELKDLPTKHKYLLLLAEEYADDYGRSDLNEIASRLLQSCNGKDTLMIALKVSKASLERPFNRMKELHDDLTLNTDVYAHILYKLERREEAIKVEEQALELAKKGPWPSNVKYIGKRLENMRSDQVKY